MTRIEDITFTLDTKIVASVLSYKQRIIKADERNDCKRHKEPGTTIPWSTTLQVERIEK